jgi:hypothetical protein
MNICLKFNTILGLINFKRALTCPILLEEKRNISDLKSTDSKFQTLLLCSTYKRIYVSNLSLLCAITVEKEVVVRQTDRQAAKLKIIEKIKLAKQISCNFRYTQIQLHTRSLLSYFSNMKYGFTCWSLVNIFLIANFHVLGLFIHMYKTSFPSVTRRCQSCWRCRPGVNRNLYRRYLSRLKG